MAEDRPGLSKSVLLVQREGSVLMKQVVGGGARFCSGLCLTAQDFYRVWKNKYEICVPGDLGECLNLLDLQELPQRTQNQKKAVAH